VDPRGRLALVASAALAAAVLAPGPASAAFPGGNGKIVFEDDGILKSIEATGAGVTSIPNSTGGTEPAISADGTHIAVNGIKTFNLSGDDQKTLASGLRPAWSPDGQRIVYDSGGDLFVINADGTGSPQALTNGADNDSNPSWDPSGTRIAFIRNQEAWALKPDDPATPAWKVSSTGSVHDGPSWSPDGTKVVYSIDDGTIVDLYVSTVPAPPADPSNPPAPAAGNRITVNGASSVFNDEPAWSPDGRLIAFSSNRTGAREIWTINAPGGGNPVQRTTSGGRRPDWQAGDFGKHYRVELKAWIPKAAIVDPNIPYEAPLAALGFAPLTLAIADERRPCNDGGLQALALLVRSNFRGDTHAEYDGSFRVRPVAEFDWDGSQITNFVVTSPPEHFGITSLDYQFRRIGGGETQECSVTKQQVAAAGGTQLSANSFELSMSADDPLVFPRTSAPDSPLVPNIDARLRGTVQPDGRLSIAYDTDLFPSHGLRVTVDGRDLETQVTNDVSCLADSSVQGLFGMGLLASALSAHINVGSVDVDPAQAPRSSSAPGRVCTGEFSTVDFVSLGQSLLGSARAASAASTLRIAPLDSAGKPGGFVTLKQAVAQGLVARQDISASHFVLGITPDQPVALRSRGQMALTVTRLLQGRRGRSAQFGPIKGRIKATLTRSSVRVTRNGKRVRPRKPDKRPPKTSAEVRVRGKTALVTFKARDRSGVQATIVTLKGKRLKLRRQRLRIARSKLPKLRVFSMDVYGNAEKPKRIRRR
jgi:hypothetical protein